MAGFMGLTVSAGRLAIQPAINFGVAHDDLHVLPRLSERNGLHEFGGLFVVAFSPPSRHAVFARVEGGQRSLGFAELPHQVRQVERSELQIVLWIERSEERRVGKEGRNGGW